MSNVKIIRTAQRQRKDALRRARNYKFWMEDAENRINDAHYSLMDARAFSSAILRKFIKERRKFIAACVVSGIAIAVAGITVAVAVVK